jgi:excisionase family DNA binding protein
MSDLATILDALPDDALVPVWWLRRQLELAAGTRADEIVVDFSCAEVAEQLGRTPGTIRGWCARGEIPGAYRLNTREWRIPRAGLRSYLDQQSERRRDRDPAGPVDLGSWRRLTGGVPAGRRGSSRTAECQRVSVSHGALGKTTEGKP